MILSTPNSSGTPPGARLLAILNPFTGQIRLVGNTGQRYAAIAFDSEGTLYGLTGQQSGTANPVNPSTLFTINKNTGASTIFLPLVVGADGESLAFNPIDGLLYRLSGGNVNQVFESINPVSQAVTQIPRSGDVIGEATALTHISGNVLYAASFDDLFTLTTDGSASFVSELDHQSKGLAFDCGVPTGLARPIPTLSEWGLIAMAGVLGIIGLFAIRRKKAVV
jgi:exosortase sorting signal-containing protein